MPTKRNLREALLFCFYLKKSAADYTSFISTRKYFRHYKKGDLDTEDKERPGQPKKFEDEDVEALLDQDPSQTQEELAERYFEFSICNHFSQ